MLKFDQRRSATVEECQLVARYNPQDIAISSRKIFIYVFLASMSETRRVEACTQLRISTTAASFLRAEGYVKSPSNDAKAIVH